MMKSLFSILLLSILVVACANAQYYYKDIITNKQISSEMQGHKDKKIHTVNIKSFEDDGSPSEGFYCQKKISRDYRKVEVLTKSNQVAPSIFTSLFNENGRVISTNDSSSIFSSTTRYMYDNAGRLTNVISISRSDDDDFRNEMREEHIYRYNSNNDYPEKMVRVRNSTDSITIQFALDERNNLGIEKDSKTGNKFYYYYDEKNRPTDIVSSNDFKKGLVPTYVFEYNNSGLITQMTVSEEGIGNYLIWKYNYEDGLRVREKCYSKDRRLLGTIEYEYK
ncbi:MAG: hypothetical protein ABIY51_03465 [Ferruginibacter sp.]